MKKLDLFGTAKLRNNEHYQFMTDVDGLIKKVKTTELGIADIYPAFKSAFDEEDKAMVIELGSSKSKAIEEGDTARDNTWNAIYKRVKSCLLSPVDAEVKAAVAIKRIFDLYGDPRRDNFNEETAAITNLVNDLLLPANRQFIDTLGLLAWVNTLKKQNDDFQTLFNDRNAELSIRNSGNVRAARKKTDPLWEQIFDRINATIIMGQAKPTVETFVKEFNEKVKYYKTTLSIREGRKQKDKPEDTSSDKK